MARTGRPKDPITDTHRLIADNLKRARDAHKFGQAEAAAALEMPLSTLQKHEQAQHKIDTEWLRFYAQGYGYDTDDFYLPASEQWPRPRRARPVHRVFTLQIAPGVKLPDALVRRALRLVAELNEEAAGRPPQ